MIFDGSKPIYIQLADFYERVIRLGGIKAGEYLPSVREVAGSEGINPNTVARSFQLLSDRGLVSPIEKKGYLVKEAPKDDRMFHLVSVLDSLSEEGYSKEEIVKSLNDRKRNGYD